MVAEVALEVEMAVLAVADFDSIHCRWPSLMKGTQQANILVILVAEDLRDCQTCRKCLESIPEPRVFRPLVLEGQGNLKSATHAVRMAHGHSFPRQTNAVAAG
jgi:hypothetical protein